jgi:hypothetical protein
MEQEQENKPVETTGTTSEKPSGKVYLGGNLFPINTPSRKSGDVGSSRISFTVSLLPSKDVKTY